MGERLVFEVADDQLDLGVLAVLSVDFAHGLGAVGDKRLFDEADRELAREVEVADRLGITLSSAAGRAPSLTIVDDRVQVGAGMPADGGELRFASGQGSTPTFELGALRVAR